MLDGFRARSPGPRQLRRAGEEGSTWTARGCGGSSPRCGRRGHPWCRRSPGGGRASDAVGHPTPVLSSRCGPRRTASSPQKMRTPSRTAWSRSSRSATEQGWEYTPVDYSRMDGAIAEPMPVGVTAPVGHRGVREGTRVRHLDLRLRRGRRDPEPLPIGPTGDAWSTRTRVRRVALGTAREAYYEALHGPNPGGDGLGRVGVRPRERRVLRPRARGLTRATTLGGREVPGSRGDGPHLRAAETTRRSPRRGPGGPRAWRMQYPGLADCAAQQLIYLSRAKSEG